MPGHPWLVALGCPRCGWTTGYGTDASVLRERWEAGDVVGPLSEADLLGDGAGVAP